MKLESAIVPTSTSIATEQAAHLAADHWTSLIAFGANTVLERSRIYVNGIVMDYSRRGNRGFEKSSSSAYKEHESTTHSTNHQATGQIKDRIDIAMGQVGNAFTVQHKNDPAAARSNSEAVKSENKEEKEIRAHKSRAKKALGSYTSAVLAQRSDSSNMRSASFVESVGGRRGQYADYREMVRYSRSSQSLTLPGF